MKTPTSLQPPGEAFTEAFCSPCQAWIGAENNGIVICAQCDCMAGLGEACSHITAILFALDANMHARKSMSCISLPCSWLPLSSRTVPFAPILNIDFSAPDKKLNDSTSVSRFSC